MLVGIAAPNQCRSQLVHPSRSFQTRHRLALAMKVVAQVSVGVEIPQDCCGRKVVALNTGVGANTDVLNTDQIPYMVVVIGFRCPPIR